MNSNIVSILQQLGGNAQGPPGAMSGPPAQGSKISSMMDPRGARGALARGRNVYAGGLMAPPGAGRPRKPNLVHSGGGPMPPMIMNAIQRRLSGSTTGY